MAEQEMTREEINRELQQKYAEREAEIQRHSNKMKFLNIRISYLENLLNQM